MVLTFNTDSLLWYDRGIQVAYIAVSTFNHYNQNQFNNIGYNTKLYSNQEPE
jgi:hypothetical protein